MHKPPTAAATWLGGAPPELVDQYKNQFTTWCRVLRKAAGHVSHGRRKRDMKMVLLARQEIERTQAAFNSGSAVQKLACRRGCPMCCYFRVDVSAVEAERIASLVERLPEERRSETLTRLRAAKRPKNAVWTPGAIATLAPSSMGPSVRSMRIAR